MKLDSKILVAVAMAIGVLATTGCSTLGSSDDNAIAPEESAASAPVEENSADPGFEQNSRRGHYGRHYYAPHAPPAARREVYGRAPSHRHFWAPGYYRWNGRQHVWYGGRWEVQRSGYQYVAPHWENRWGRWEYIPGYWARRY